MNNQVIIVGGGIAGLSLANMLEKVQIPFTLLEAYPEIALDVGASLALLPNSLRILDQLGCFERLVEMTEGCYRCKTYLCDSDGVAISCTGEYSSLNPEKRYERHSGSGHASLVLSDAKLLAASSLGYPAFFIERRKILKVLYENLRHKNRVLTQMRVSRAHLQESGVQVVTKDGSRFHGAVVVGADGVHCGIRKEMRRLANKKAPGDSSGLEKSQVRSLTYLLN